MVSYPYDKILIDEIIEIMIETVISNGDTIRVASNKYSYSFVKERFLGIEYSYIEYIISFFKENTKNKFIKNIKQYMKTLVFNAPATIDSYYSVMVNKDLYGY